MKKSRVAAEKLPESEKKKPAAAKLRRKRRHDRP